MSPAGKLVVITAPSGAGKTTVVRYLLQQFQQLQFSISATTRLKRENEIDGRDYYFMQGEEFQQHIAKHDFIEYQEVYPGKFYGTLRSEVERIWQDEKSVIFDVDVKGAENLQRMYPVSTLTIFIRPPSAEILIERLRKRQSETEASLAIRLERVKMEMQQEAKFDHSIINDVLETTLHQAYTIVNSFLNKEDN